MIYVGIDPGKKGAIAILWPDSKCTLLPVPLVKDDFDLMSMLAVLEHVQDHCVEVFVVLEKAQAMPRQGVVGMFNYGIGFGMWLALLYASGLGKRFECVPAATWAKAMLPFKTATKDKNKRTKERKAARALKVKELHPDLVLKREEYADAVLLAHYAKRLKEKDYDQV